jgi:hypothetical protein
VTVKVPAAAHLPLFDAALFDPASFDAASPDTAMPGPARSEAAGRVAEPTVVISPHASHRSGVRARRTELAVTIGVALLVGAITFAVGGRRPGAPEAGSQALPAQGGGSTGAALAAAGTGSAVGSPGASPTAASPSPGASTGSPSPDPAASTAGGIPPGAAGSQGTTSTSVAVSTAAGGLGVADPIGYLEGLRAQIQALVAQGPAMIDPNAAGDLQNLVLDLENSVVAYQQNGGAAHVQEIRNKIAGFDARLAQLVGQGRLAQSAADQLAAYLGRLAPA